MTTPQSPHPYGQGAAEARQGAIPRALPGTPLDYLDVTAEWRREHQDATNPLCTCGHRESSHHDTGKRLTYCCTYDSGRYCGCQVYDMAGAA